MNEHEVLQHLLDLEKEAAALIDDAQAEADRRVSEGEKQNRLKFDEVYSNELKALESSFAEKIAAVNEDYSKQQEQYQEGLKKASWDFKNFSSVALKLFHINDQTRDEL